ncbi:MAG: hypothetical protein QOA13_09740 [Nitrososphaeraceae archaeon]|nr:hypothetical protein [Nitrososphaeraceae archaeon]MDW0169598.1 hypothetical protein [Nitrososphaeraceae archaeon]MDW0237475.1 hypothetical protein [Nitrososphaeraceae archaeon]MDW0254364.1 hypothetical protein [Nitrososphaeraceae archaeon]MDW0278240.1 hypothetical protein [Nitrososphaeraceae archaeon]
MVKRNAINTTGAGSGNVERLKRKNGHGNPCLIKEWHSKNNSVIKIR